MKHQNKIPRSRHQMPVRKQDHKITIKTFNNLVTLIGLLELQAETIEALTYDHTLHKGHLKNANNNYHAMITKEIERFYRGLDEENQKRYFKQVKGLKDIISKMIYEVDQKSKEVKNA